MDNTEPQKTDWIHLPDGSEVFPLWDCLHDGELLSSKSVFVEQSVLLEIRVGYLLTQSEKDVHFLFRLEGIESIRANVYFREYKESEIVWREESISWRDLEESLSTDPLQITDGDLATNQDNIALHIGGFLDGEKFNDLYCSVFLRAKSVSVARSDNKDFSLENFIESGRNYWDSFGKKGRQIESN